VVELAVSAYLQYLRISGQFHVIAGVLCLFGFNLPATNRWFFLASSLTDMWRRINVYWRDFSQKIVYFPIFMRLRKIGPTKAMVIATAAVFVCSWLLHSYQWFWIRGEFPIAAVDMAFWGVIAALVIATSLFEARRKRPARDRPTHPLLSALGRSARTLSVFCLMCLLWSLWCSDSPGDWADTVSRAGNGGPGQLAAVAAVVVGALVVGTGIAFAAAKGVLRAPRLGYWAGAAATCVAAVALVAVGFAAERLEGRARAAEVLASLTEPQLSERDAEIRALGYYEGLLATAHPSPVAAPAEVAQSIEAPADWLAFGKSGLARRVPDYRLYEIKRSVRTTFKRAAFSTNVWGMRDRHYPKPKPAGTFRIALLGASPEMGSGVADGENYESLLEQRLNADRAAPSGLRYEVLNFGVAGWGVAQQAAKCEADLFEFEPDAVMVAAHTGGDVVVSLRLFRNIARRRVPLPAELARIVDGAGIRGHMRGIKVARILKPHYEEITRWGYRRIVELCRERGAVPIWIYVPLPEDFQKKKRSLRAEEDELTPWAVEAGFHTISAAGVFDGIDPRTLTVAPWDNHPNRKGAELIAERLFDELSQRPELIAGERR
jgi:hypothetical protein